MAKQLSGGKKEAEDRAEGAYRDALRFVFHCIKCGAILTYGKPHLSSFSPDSGSPLFVLDLRCPQKRWWNKHTTGMAAIWSDTELFMVYIGDNIAYQCNKETGDRKLYEG